MRLLPLYGRPFIFPKIQNLLTTMEGKKLLTECKGIDQHVELQTTQALEKVL